MNTVTKKAPPSNTAKQIVCKKCKSTQISGHKKGFSFGKFFLYLFLAFLTAIFAAIFAPIIITFGVLNGSNEALGIIIGVSGFLLFFTFVLLAFIMGFSGRSNIINGCMNCGNKWIAGKK